MKPYLTRWCTTLDLIVAQLNSLCSPERHFNNSIYDLYGVSERRSRRRRKAKGKEEKAGLVNLISQQVLVHEGSSLQYGHYLSYVKHACKHKEGSWYQMDDRWERSKVGDMS